MERFHKVDLALPREAHNASPIRTKDGLWYIFHIGSAGDSGSTFLHYSEQPGGPWKALESIECNNPAPMLHNNGTLYVGCNNGGFQILRSSERVRGVHGTWSHVATMEFPDTWGKASPYLKNEDPYLWM